MKQRLRVEVRGVVQGVGFRPFVFRLARRLELAGSIHNSESGVCIEIEGQSDGIQAFLVALPAELPPLARLDEVETTPLEPMGGHEFLITESTRTSRSSTLIAPDIATCDACVQELLAPSDRRFLYPFLNCTNCGPRFTIVRSVPYDRAQTSMAAFTMCARCQAEYDDPENRRFHAQPNACPDCGPQATLLDRHGTPLPGDPIAETVRLLQEGAILAIKGLGGFHLAVDALQPERVLELRRRKHRGEKPFAVMVRDLEAAARLCLVSEAEADLLQSPQRPIVLLRRRTSALDSLAPDGDQLGIFLPYTPIHHLLFRGGHLSALVMTSGNLSEEPIAIANDEAVTLLGGIADFLLVHNREILLRCDDSVVRHTSRGIQFVRRSRGYVPSPVRLVRDVPPILAVGGELKNTICLSRDRYAFPGQHIGDLENLSAYEFFLESIQHFQTILEISPKIIAHDLHPGYLATRWAKQQTHLRAFAVQHHHAHIASCMAEHQLEGPVIGVALDGTGFGADGNTWGGEVLVADLASFTRAAHLSYNPMPGGDKATHEPWRMTVGCLWRSFGEAWRDFAPPHLLAAIPASAFAIVEQMLRAGTNTPLSSSCGRLFDAVAAMVCQRTHVSYEAQAAIALEACCDPDGADDAYPFPVVEGACLEIETKPLFAALAEDLRSGVAPGKMSRRFHNGLVNGLAEAVARTAGRTGLQRVCLSGGSFQNAQLSSGLERALVEQGLEVYTQTQVPCGDGGLSLGQLVIAANQP